MNKDPKGRPSEAFLIYFFLTYLDSSVFVTLFDPFGQNCNLSTTEMSWHRSRADAPGRI